MTRDKRPHFLLGDSPAARAFERRRFVVLLGTLALLLLAAPVAAVFDAKATFDLARIVTSALVFLMLLSAVAAVAPTRRTVALATVLAAPALVLQIAVGVSGHSALAAADCLVTLPFLGYTIGVVVLHLFRARTVDIDTISAAACVYLLLGLMWAMLFSFVEMTAPGSFDVLTVDAPDGESLRFGAEHTVLALYYSYTTLTTLGYGDVVPLTPPARMLSVLEAIVGQLFIAVLVARLVGLQVAHAHDKHVADER